MSARNQAGIPWLRRGWDDPKPKPEPMMTYDFPLRPGFLIRFTVPLNLTAPEAERITAFVDALVFP